MSVAVVAKSIPAAAAAIAVALLAFWLTGRAAPTDIELRVPNPSVIDESTTQPSTQATTMPTVDLRGEPVAGPGKSGEAVGAWPCFRGSGRDGTSTETIALLTNPPAAGFNRLWQINVGEGYAGAAIRDGRVYLMDYDDRVQEDTLRCLSIDDGKEIWHRGYKVPVAWDHGFSRTVPAISGKYVVAMGPMCHVTCVDAESGKFIWGVDLVQTYGVKVPAWYAGQCPLIDGDRVILGLGGESPYVKRANEPAPRNTQPLLIALNLADGKPVVLPDGKPWRTPNPRRWKMTHTSVVPMDLGGTRTYVYAASEGAIGVSADTGQRLWEYTEWQVPTAAVASPLPLPGNRLLLSGGYGTGAAIIQISQGEGKWNAKQVLRLKPTEFGSPQHTPIFQDGFVYGVIPTGEMACMDLDGRIVWKSKKSRFGLGGFILAGGALWVMSDSGVLTVIEATPAECRILGQMKVFEDGEEAWGPPAVAGGKLIVRDTKRMACLDIRKK